MTFWTEVQCSLALASREQNDDVSRLEFVCLDPLLPTAGAFDSRIRSGIASDIVLQPENRKREFSFFF